MSLRSLTKYAVTDKDRAYSIEVFHFSAIEALGADLVNKYQQAGVTGGEDYHLYLLKAGKYLTKSFYNLDDFPSYTVLRQNWNKSYSLPGHSK